MDIGIDLEYTQYFFINSLCKYFYDSISHLFYGILCEKNR